MKTAFISITLLIITIIGGFYIASDMDTSPQQTQIRKEIILENN